jgi:hypothetical protein
MSIFFWRNIITFILKKSIISGEIIITFFFTERVEEMGIEKKGG